MIKPELQKLNQTSGLVYLYILDATNYDAGVFRFTPNVDGNGGNVSFNGVPYIGIPMAVSGWDVASAGSPPKPTVTVANVNKYMLSTIIANKHLIGATFTRICTFAKFLDGGSDEDGSQFLPPSTYVIEQLTSHDDVQITWQLTSIIDRMGMRIPRRQINKDKGFPGVSRNRVR